jgi:hypothetical protein
MAVSSLTTLKLEAFKAVRWWSSGLRHHTASQMEAERSSKMLIIYAVYKVSVSEKTRIYINTSILVSIRLCGLVVRVPGYRTEMYCFL